MDAAKLARWVAAERFIRASDLMRLLNRTGRATHSDIEYVCHAREALEYYDHPGIASELVGPLAPSVSKPEFGSVKFS